MKIMIIEDEPQAIKILEKYIAKIPDASLEFIYSNPIEGLQVLNQQSIDLLLLDINLPEISGLELLRSLVKPPKVILTTAYPEYALDGYELEVVDYLLKPFSFDRFLKSVNKVSHQLELEKIAQQIPDKDMPNILMIKADRKLFQVPFNEIIMLQAFGDYVKVITQEKQLLPKETLQNLITQLPENQFTRIHRSYVVALSSIEYIEGNQVFIAGKYYPIGKPYKDALIEKIKNQ